MTRKRGPRLQDRIRLFTAGTRRFGFNLSNPCCQEEISHHIVHTRRQRQNSHRWCWLWGSVRETRGTRPSYTDLSAGDATSTPKLHTHTHMQTNKHSP